MDEVLEISTEINYSNLAYNVKGQSSSTTFAEFGGPI